MAGNPTFSRIPAASSRCAPSRLRHVQTDPLHRLLERLTIFSLVNGFREAPISLTPYFSNTPRFTSPSSHQRRLSAHRRQQRIGAFTFYDFLDDLERDRLDIRAVGEFGIGHNRRRVAVDENDFEALFPQRFAGLRAGVVKLTA